MYRTVAPVLALTLGLGAFVSSCQLGVSTQGDPDMRDPFDLRTSPGNPLIGATCDENMACADDPQGMGPARCATIVELDSRGACAPSCSTDKDCDTDKPGQSFCTQMSGSGKSECVLFCDKDKLVGGRECPENWTCASSQGFFICRPPQTKPM